MQTYSEASPLVNPEILLRALMTRDAAIMRARDQHAERMHRPKPRPDPRKIKRRRMAS